MALSVTAIFVNSLGGRPRLLVEAIGSVGRSPEPDAEPAPAGAARGS
jgi:Cu+-exporting ATPase